MSIFEDSTCTRCREAGEKLFLKGEKCSSPKCPFVRRSYGPGQHGQSRRKKPSDFSNQLAEKQKAKILYGINEEQFRRYYEAAEQQGERLLRLLERRLDNVVFRLGFARSRVEGRKLIVHGQFMVNEKNITIPSYQVNIGDVISAKNAAKQPFIEIEKRFKDVQVPLWLSKNDWEGKMLDYPADESIDSQINEQLIVEFYSR